jgi:hypothetical protein
MAHLENWITLRNSGIRIAFIGFFSLIIAFIIYSHLTTPSRQQPVMITPYLKELANAILVITFVSMISIIYGVYIIFKAQQLQTANKDKLMSYIIAAFSDNKYWKIMLISAAGYGIFFGFVSHMFIYRNDISFVTQGIAVPSVNVTPCCNLPGYVPIFAAYLTDHFLILLIPINIILAIIISALVGFNISLNLYAFKLTKMKSTKKVSFVGSIGAIGGLFIGCPTCAGSLFSTLLGFGAGATFSVLAPLQIVFIIVSIPVLLITPFLIARMIQIRSSTCKLT